MIKCKKCGTEYDDGASYCNKCDLDLIDTPPDKEGANTPATENSMKRTGSFVISVMLFIFGVYSYITYYTTQAALFLLGAYICSTISKKSGGRVGSSIVKWLSLISLALVLGGKVIYYFVVPGS